MLVELVILCALHADDKSEAEQLFRKMETKLRSAKSLECTYVLTWKEGTRQRRFNESVALAEGNKFRWENMLIGDKEKPSIVICDGETRTSIGEKGEEKSVPAPKWLNDAHRAALARSGVALYGLSQISFFGSNEWPKEFKADDAMKVSDFKFGKKEKVGDQDVQAVQYKLGVGGLFAKNPLAVTVWIDTKTNLPLKREVIDEQFTFIETFSKWAIDEKIDPKKFELPKD